MGIFDFFFKKRPDYASMIANGAQVIDVRSPAEFSSGHASGAVNIPLDRIRSEAGRLKKKGGPVILCCASGIRSGKAANILKSEGIEACNAGGWRNLP